MPSLIRRLLPRPVRRFARGLVDALPARLRWRRMLTEARREHRPLPPLDGGHVCLCAWYFPPTVTGGTYRPAALAKYGSEAGLDFTVISSPLFRKPSAAGRYLAAQLPSDVRVIRVRTSPLEPLASVLPSIDGGALNAHEIWRAGLAAFDERRPEFVIATGPPFHTFVAAHLLAARFEVPLVLEYRDEWTECPFEFVRSGPDDRLWERRCLAGATRVVFTTRSQLERHVEVFPELEREKCVVIPNGWEPADAPEFEIDGDPPSARGDEGPLTISFTGNLGNHTLPRAFLQCLAESIRRRPALGRFRFRFVGQRSERAESQLASFPHPQMLRIDDQVPKDEVPRILHESTGLLLLNPPAFERYIPGKLYEYLAAGRPILVYGEGGEVARLVARLGAGYVVTDGDPEGLADALESIATHPPGLHPGTARARWLQRHTRRVLAQRTVRLLEEVREEMKGTDGVAPAKGMVNAR